MKKAKEAQQKFQKEIENIISESEEESNESSSSEQNQNIIINVNGKYQINTANAAVQKMNQKLFEDNKEINSFSSAQKSLAETSVMLDYVNRINGSGGPLNNHQD